MSTIELIIQQILEKNPETTREQILTRLSVARNMTGGLIADDSLLRMIAAEIGVEIPNEDGTFKHRLSIGHLVAGLNNVTVTGRVAAIYPVKNFEGLKPGKLGSVTIIDNDGVLRVILWNEKANLIEKGELQIGQIVKFAHGYTKADRFNTPELHIGERSQIELNPETSRPEDYPSIAKFSSKINEITVESKNVNLHGTIKEVFSPSTFIRGDQSQGKVQRVRIYDETGELVLVFWNEKAEEIQLKLKKGEEVQIVNGRIKAGQQPNELEIHVDSSAYASITETPRKLVRIADLTDDSNDICVEGEVATLPVTKDVKTSKGEIVKLTTFDLKDETGIVRVTTWREHADTSSKLVFGERIILEKVYAKTGYSGKVELSTRSTTIITHA